MIPLRLAIFDVIGRKASGQLLDDVLHMELGHIVSIHANRRQFATENQNSLHVQTARFTSKIMDQIRLKDNI